MYLKEIMLSKVGRLLLATIVFFGVISVFACSFSGIRYLDKVWLHEFVKDLVGRVWWHEDWDTVPILRANTDSSWMGMPAIKPLRIAHALGAAGKIEANTLEAARASLQAGWTHLEVDIWLDDSGQLRCHHGPDAPPPLTDSDCTFERLLSLISGPNQWLILDIKTSFQQTGRRILDTAIKAKREGQLIFQLYRPDDVVSFVEWQQEVQLPTPILTAYASRRSLNELLKQAERIHIKAFTFPLDRAVALTRRSATVSLYVHPIHDCRAFHQAQILDVAGIYATNDLSCITNVHK